MSVDRNERVERVALAALEGGLLVAMVVLQIARKSSTELWIGDIDRLNHFPHLGPFTKTQGDSFSHRLDFSLTARLKELSKVHAVKSTGHRHVDAATNVIAVAYVLFSSQRFYVLADLVDTETKLSPPTSTTQ